MIITSFLIIARVLLFPGSVSASIFFKIEGNGLSKPSYLFGTHHLAPVSIIDSIKGCTEALDEVAAIVGELDMTTDKTAMSLKMIPYMLAPADSTLSSLYNKEEFKRLSEEFARWAPDGMGSLNMLDMMRPMAITSIVTIEMVKKSLPQFDPDKQLDSYFQIIGKEAGKKIIALESPEMQAELLFHGTPLTVQAATLKELLDNPDEALQKSEALNKAYLNQDLEVLYKMNREEESEFMIAIVDNRNENWLRQLPAIMTSTPAFIAVGALHLPGPNGLIEGLRKSGYTVTPLE